MATWYICSPSFRQSTRRGSWMRSAYLFDEKFFYTGVIILNIIQYSFRWEVDTRAFISNYHFVASLTKIEKHHVWSSRCWKSVNRAKRVYRIQDWSMRIQDCKLRQSEKNLHSQQLRITSSRHRCYPSAVFKCIWIPFTRSREPHWLLLVVTIAHISATSTTTSTTSTTN